MPAKERVDRLLVTRGLFESRARAQAAIAAGRVTADGVVVRRPSDSVSASAAIVAEPEHPYVSRGGVKFAAALDHFKLDVAGRVCLDVGASTGGFTEVLLQCGAKRVYAVDVGHGQLHPRLRGRDSVDVIEQTDIRKLDPLRLREQPDFAAIDVSFISLKRVLPAVAKLLNPRSDFVALIKPQFETGRSDNKRGIVRDDAVHRLICNDISAFVAALGWRVGQAFESPIRGRNGNREFFIAASRG